MNSEDAGFLSLIGAEVCVAGGDLIVDCRGANLGRRGFEILGGASELAWLSLSRTDATNELITLLKGLPSLEFLSLDETRVTGHGLATVSTFPSLKILHLRRIAKFSTGLKNILQCKGIESLDLSGTDVTGKSLRSIATRLPMVTYIDASDTAVDPEDVRDLDSNQSGSDRILCVSLAAC